MFAPKVTDQNCRRRISHSQCLLVDRLLTRYVPSFLLLRSVACNFGYFDHLCWQLLRRPLFLRFLTRMSVSSGPTKLHIGPAIPNAEHKTRSCRGFAYWGSGATLPRQAVSNVGDVICPRKPRPPGRIGRYVVLRPISSIEWQRKRKIHTYSMSFSFASCPYLPPKDQHPRRNSNRKSHFVR